MLDSFCNGQYIGVLYLYYGTTLFKDLYLSHLIHDLSIKYCNDQYQLKSNHFRTNQILRSQGILPADIKQNRTNIRLLIFVGGITQAKQLFPKSPPIPPEACYNTTPKAPVMHLRCDVDMRTPKMPTCVQLHVQEDKVPTPKIERVEILRSSSVNSTTKKLEGEK